MNTATCRPLVIAVVGPVPRRESTVAGMVGRSWLRGPRGPPRCDGAGRSCARTRRGTPGRAVSKLEVAKFLCHIAEVFDLLGTAYDRWRIEDFKALADDNGLSLPPMEPFGQGYKDMSPAVEAFETHLLNGTAVHPGNPVLTWCAANAVVVSDDAENRALTSAIGTPAPRAAASRFGQISRSMSRPQRGRQAAMKRRVAPGKS